MRDGLWSKYFGQQDVDLYGGTVVGRSLEGFPILGQTVPYLTQREMEDMPVFSTFRSDWFRLWVPEEKSTFDKIYDHVFNGEFFIKHRVDVPVPNYPPDEPGGSLKVWLEWVQVEAKPRNWTDPAGGLPQLPKFSANIPIHGPQGG